MPDLTDQIDIPWQDQPAVEPVDAPVVPPSYQPAPVDMGVDSSGQTAGDRWWKTNAAYGQMLRAQEENLRLARTRDAVSAAEEFIRRKEVERLVKSGAPLEVAEFQTRARSLKPMAAPVAPPQLMTLGGSPAVPAHTVQQPFMYMGDPSGEAAARAAQPVVNAPATVGIPGVTGVVSKGVFRPLPIAKPLPGESDIAPKSFSIDLPDGKTVDGVYNPKTGHFIPNKKDVPLTVTEKYPEVLATPEVKHWFGPNTPATAYQPAKTIKRAATAEETGQSQESQSSSGIPKVGEVRKGYKFKGGNPADKNSWELVK